MPSMFVEMLGQIVGTNSLLMQIVRVLPTYYLADGASKVMQGQGSLSGQLLDLGVVLCSTLTVLLAATWHLRRQSTVAAAL